MKTIFLSFITFLSISTFSFGQDASNIATAQTKNELVSSKESGNYVFILPAGLSVDDVNKNAKYYVHYFTVEYLEKTNQANITMITNDDKSRHVIMRFLTACGVRYVMVDGNTVSLEDFFVNFVQ